MELSEIIKKMDELRDELELLRPIPEDCLNRLNQKLRLDWNYHSNNLEGNTLTASETRAFLLYGITAKGKPFRDYVEMRGHNEALKKLENIVHRDVKITEKLIKEFHKIILVEPHSGEAEINPGKYKSKPNYLYSPTGERVDFEPPLEVPRLMNELINWLNNHINPPKRKSKKYVLHPLLIACGFHVRFIQIHPFGDGNGRMARILMNLILVLCGYVPAVIKLEKRKEYYTALNLSTLDNMVPLSEFVGIECIQSLEMALKAAKGESIEDTGDFDKEIEMLKRMQNQPKVKIMKSKQAMQNTLQQVYFPLIQNLNTNFVKLNKLFTKHTWLYFEEPKQKEGAPILPKYALIDDLIRHLKSVSEKHSNTYHQYKAAYWLLNYNDYNDFSMEISLKIYFYETSYSIGAFVGQPYASSLMMKAFGMLIKSFKKEKPFDLFKDYRLLDNEYDKMVLKEDIIDYANQLSNDALAYIKLKVNEKGQ